MSRLLVGSFETYVSSLEHFFSETVQGQDRATQMETRLVVAEQSNRALLDEVLRLQGQLQSAVRASQDALAAERKSRDQLESVLIRLVKKKLEMIYTA